MRTSPIRNRVARGRSIVEKILTFSRYKQTCYCRQAILRSFFHIRIIRIMFRTPIFVVVLSVLSSSAASLTFTNLASLPKDSLVSLAKIEVPTPSTPC
jgi:hypothetical protein